MKRLTALALLALSISAQSATLANYQAQCKAFEAHRPVFEGVCSVSVGPDMQSGSMVYSVDAPDGSRTFAVQHFGAKHSGTVDGIPARELAVVPGWLHFVTVKGFDLRFTAPPKDLAM